MNRTKLGLAGASVLVAGAIIGAGTSLASAATTPTPAASQSAGASAANGADGASGANAANGAKAGGQMGHTHTDATAEEAQKVKDAIKAKDATVTIDTVQKDEDGSFDASGTKADGTKVRYDVSADLATVTEGRGGPGGGPGGGASQDTPVTGDEAQKVIDAVKAKDSTVTIDTVRKDPDGSYDALGSAADGTKVMFDVSADLATVSQGRGGPGGDGGAGGGHGRGQAPSSTGAGTSGSAANGATSSAG